MKPETEKMVQDLVSGVGATINRLVSVVVVLLLALIVTIVTLIAVVT